MVDRDSMRLAFARSRRIIEDRRSNGGLHVIDVDTFREVLSHHPTGVSLVTGRTISDEPIGMVVGTFNSVSLDPPLVAFMPMRSSRTWEQMEPSGRFCINVLGADQQQRCASFLRSPMEERFTAWPWVPSPGDLPVLDDVVAWVECSTRDVVEAGDHWIVIGAVDAFEVRRPVAPLLHFQGGFGRFAPLGAATTDEPIRAGAVDAERARPILEQVAADHGGEVTLVNPIGGDSLAVVGAATAPGSTGSDRLGLRIPFIPPVGDVFAAFGDSGQQERWLDRSPERGTVTPGALRRRLDLVRRRGWSASLADPGRYTDERLRRALCEFTTGTYTPATERQIRSAVSATGEYYSTGPVRSTEAYDVGSIAVPIFSGDGRVRSALRFAPTGRTMTGAALLALVRHLQGSARRVEDLAPAVGAAATPALQLAGR